MVEDRVVDSNINGFSSFLDNIFAILIYYPEEGDVGMGCLLEMLCM